MPPTEANPDNADNAASGDGDARGKAIAALIESGALEEAERLCRERIAAGEVDATLFSQMAGLCGRRGLWQELRQWVERALALEPDQASAHSHLGVALRQAGDRDGAIASFRRALALAPSDVNARSNLGTALQEQGDLEGAQACYRQAIAERPSFAEAHTNLGMLLLLQGHYPEGWQEYEWRHAIPRATWGLLARPRSPRWDGNTPLAAGEELLLVAEQGLGDTLQFARYLLPLRRAGLAVRLCAQPQLHGLLRSSGLDPDPLSPTQAAEDWNGPWLPLLSLPGVLGVTPETPIHSDPHLQPDPGRIERWRTRLAQAPRPLVAIAWQGNPEAEQTTLRGRSLPLESFSPLAHRTDITFLSLQKGFGAEQLASCSFRHRFLDIQSEIDQAWDFLDAAALLACCDLVLTSDTALAHLAAGMGRPTWLLLQNLPEWRWGLQGDSSPWYPSLRIFRQSTPGDWTSLLHHVADEFLHIQQIQALLAPPEQQATPGQQAAQGLEAAPKLEPAARDPNGEPAREPNEEEIGEPNGEPALDALLAQGRRAEAEALCRQRLQKGTAGPRVRTAFASLLGGDGRWAELEDFAALCLERDPQDAAAHDHLGIARQFQNDAAGAVVHHQRALALRPDHAPSWLNLGNALQRLGQLGDAIACYERALALRPEDATLLRNLGQALLRADEPEAALERFRQVLALRSEDAEAWNDLGQVHFQLGELHEALAAFRKALELRGDDPDLLCNVGTTLQKLGENGAAVPYLQRSLERRPDFVEAWNNLGVALQNLQQLPEAIEHLRRALTLRPDYADGYTNLGNALLQSRDFPGALDSFRSALALRSDHGDAHHNYGMALLLLGDYRRGWAEYEWRGRCSRPVQPHALPPTPVWDGRPLPPGQTLLLVSEQGLGDTLQFMRYALTLRQQGFPVRLAVQSKLHGILQASGIDPQPLHPEQADSFSDGPWLPLLSLPGILGVSPDTPLHNDPYIHTTPERLRHWQQRLAHAPRPLVAIGWQGNPAHETASVRGRSLPLESFSPLAHRTDITFLSLQKGFGAEQLASCSFRHRFLDIQSEIDQAWDFLDAAALLACCDLVLTSDTALAHLAAGMGRPTWLLLQNLPEWRWGLQGDSSPWYPSLRIFRQNTPGDWTSLLHHVADEFLHIQQLQALLAPPSPDFPTGISADAEAERLFQLGNAREEQGDSAGAIAAWRRALDLRPDYPEALNNLALTLHEQGDPRAAIATFEEALRRRPAFVAARFNLGNALQDVGALDEAIACFQQTLALQGDLAEAHLNLGSALQERGDRAAARASFEAALRLRPHDADAHGNLALLDLLEGDYERGWPGSEWRFRGPAGLALLIARPAGPRWGGEVLPAGTSLLLVAEQGLGDTLQFVRYLPLLRQRGMAVRLCAPPALHRLLEASGLENEPLTPAEGQNWSGPWLPLLSLPGLLGVSREQPLVQAPYLRVPEELVASWRRRLADERRPLLALHWQGNPEHERRHARGRSLPLDTFAPLARSGEATFLSLQKGFGAEQLAACPFRDRFVAAQEEIDQTWDFLETAAILSACDRLICADSGVAHLAGGLGHPTWLLLKDIPDWRWGLEGESSFWYPSGLHLFRQRRRGDWGEVMERVAAALEGT